MIVTVALNPVIEQTLVIPEFDKNRTLRATAITQNPGDISSIAAWFAGSKGMDCTALGFKAGTLGSLVEEMLHSQLVKTQFISGNGSTCLNTVVVSGEDHSHAVISTTTLSVTTEQMEQLKTAIESTIQDASCLILDSRLPSGISTDTLTALIQTAKAQAVPVICFADETTLTSYLEAQSDYLVVDESVFVSHLGHELETLDQAIEAIKELNTQSVLLLQKKGILAKFDTDIFQNTQLTETSIRQAAITGCLLGGLAQAIDQELTPIDGLKQGIAAALALVNQQPAEEYNIHQQADYLNEIQLELI